MGILDWFTSGSESEEDEDEEVRYLCALQEEYADMDAFMEDFFDVLEETIEKYNDANPVKAEKLDRDQARKQGGNWVYEANIERLDEESIEAEDSDWHFSERKSTFDVIARQQPNFAIEISGSKDLIAPFLEEMQVILDKEGFNYEVDTIAKLGLGKATDTEPEE
uniref:Uncharacterized protein n=1 Tax=uncultured organism TaxID=155900 RepID=M1P0D4_9ZZZZ|nr:hypothetical protein FLSS-1_0004 [uncultured organism]